MNPRMNQRRARTRNIRGDKWGVIVPEAPYYEFRELLVADDTLKRFMKMDEFGNVVTDFDNREATLALARATLKSYFSLRFTLPAGNLIPVIPGRVQYLRWATTLLPKCSEHKTVQVLDVGCGPSAIYELLGARLYPNWNFIGTDTDSQAVAIARGLVISNSLKHRVKIKRTLSSAPLLDTAIWDSEKGTETALPPPNLVICNPPFFDTADAEIEIVEPEPREQSNTERAGTSNQMNTKGGEVEFVKRMARDSVKVASTIGVFSSLIGVGRDVEKVEKYLKSDEIRARSVVTVRLDAGKTHRWAIGWKFGEDQSEVHLYRGIIRSEWKSILRIVPNKGYANRLIDAQVLDIWVKAMEMDEWEKCDENNNEGMDGNQMGNGTSILGKRSRDAADDENEEECDGNGKEAGGNEEENDEREKSITSSQVMKKVQPNSKEWKFKGSVIPSNKKDYSFYVEMSVVNKSGVEIYAIYKQAERIRFEMKKLLDEQ